MNGFIVFALAAMVATDLHAQGSCPDGRTVPDYGFGEIDCKDCVYVHPTIGPPYLSFRSEPVLRSIRSGGPAAGKLNEGDVLLSIDGLSIKSAAGARRLVELGPRTSQLMVRRNSTVRSISINPAGVCAASGPMLSSNRMSKSQLLQSSASTLTQLELSRAELVRAEVERARVVRQRFERDLASHDALVDALRRAAVADSLAVSSARQRYAQRAITRQQFDEEIGRARADAIIRATQDSSRMDSSRQDMARDSTRLRTAILAEQRLTAERINFLQQTSLELPTTSLGMGLLCPGSCPVTITGGRSVWTFSSYPVVGAVESGSIADRLGVRRGDTLKTVDDINVTSRQGGERLSAMTPGRTIKLGWSRAGVSHTASVTLSEGTLRDALRAARLSQSVGNAEVEVFGKGASWTRDPLTGALRITGDSITVIVRPPGAARDTVQRVPHLRNTPSAPL